MSSSHMAKSTEQTGRAKVKNQWKERKNNRKPGSKHTVCCVAIVRALIGWGIGRWWWIGGAVSLCVPLVVQAVLQAAATHQDVGIARRWVALARHNHLANCKVSERTGTKVTAISIVHFTFESKLASHFHWTFFPSFPTLTHWTEVGWRE
jgi:hypothetical protein